MIAHGEIRFGLYSNVRISIQSKNSARNLMSATRAL